MRLETIDLTKQWNDHAAAIQVSKEVGYKGLYSVEASRNNGPDPYAAVQTIVEELLKDI